MNRFKDLIHSSVPHFFVTTTDAYSLSLLLIRILYISWRKPSSTKSRACARGRTSLSIGRHFLMYNSRAIMSRVHVFCYGTRPFLHSLERMLRRCSTRKPTLLNSREPRRSSSGLFTGTIHSFVKFNFHNELYISFSYNPSSYWFP